MLLQPKEACFQVEVTIQCYINEKRLHLNRVNTDNRSETAVTGEPPPRVRIEINNINKNTYTVHTNKIKDNKRHQTAAQCN